MHAVFLILYLGKSATKDILITSFKYKHNYPIFLDITLACRLWDTFQVYFQRLLGHSYQGNLWGYRSYCKLQKFQETPIYMLKLHVPCMTATHCTTSNPCSCCSPTRQPKSKRRLQGEFMSTKVTEENMGRKTVILSLNTPDHSLKPCLLTLPDPTMASCHSKPHVWSHSWFSQACSLLSTNLFPSFMVPSQLQQCS